MNLNAHVGITSPDDTARVYLGGNDRDIPIVSFGAYGHKFDLAVNSLCLTPAEQAAWLRDLAHKCESLAEVIEAANVAVTA